MFDSSDTILICLMMFLCTIFLGNKLDIFKEEIKIIKQEAMFTNLLKERNRK